MAPPALLAAPPPAPVGSHLIGKSVFRTWTAGELRLKVADLRSRLQTGLSDLQCAEEMTLCETDYNALKREMYAADKLEMSAKNSEEVFIDYRMRQEGCIKDLETMVKTFKETKQYNAMVGAVRAKSDIIDKIVARGQEFGVLEKVPEKKLVVAGVLVAGLSNDELRATVAKESMGMSEMFKKYSDGGILSLPEPKKRTAADAALLPTAKVVDAEVVKPKFNAGLRPKESVGGLAKAAGGKAAVEAKKAPTATKPKLPFSLGE